MKELSKIGTRINILIRLIGLIFIITGALLAYFTSTSPIVPQIAPVYYLVAIICIVSGIVTIIAELE